jgi:hypothetical protein
MGGMGETLAALLCPPVLFALVLWGLHVWWRRKEGYAAPVGVVVASELELDAMAPTIGTYHGGGIPEWVRYHGERYDFAYVAPSRYRARVGRGELFLEPGIVYRRV